MTYQLSSRSFNLYYIIQPIGTHVKVDYLRGEEQAVNTYGHPSVNSLAAMECSFDPPSGTA